MRVPYTLIALTLFTAAATGHADSGWKAGIRKMTAHADIDGDGHDDHIRLEKFRKKKDGRWDFQYFRLTVNERSLYTQYFGSLFGFRLVNINRMDGYKEIAVEYNDGGGDAIEASIFWFDGKQILRVFSRSFTYIGVPGNGTVTSEEDVWFYPYPVPYYLQSNHTLRRTFQKFFTLHKDVVVEHPLPLYSRYRAKRPFRSLKSGVKIELLQTDENGWRQIRYSRGRKAWIHMPPGGLNESHYFGWVAAG